jgi:hypothetical protein
VLATMDHAPYAIPVSAPLRAGSRTVLLSLHRSRGSLARLRERRSMRMSNAPCRRESRRSWGLAASSEPSESDRENDRGDEQRTGSARVKG